MHAIYILILPLTYYGYHVKPYIPVNEYMVICHSILLELKLQL